MSATGQQERRRHPSHLMAAATRAYTLAKELGRQQEAVAIIRKAFTRAYGDLRGECFYSIWLEWVDEA